jgi:hypothetical protein
VGLEQGPLSLVSTIHELLGRKTENTSVGIRHADKVAHYPETLALTSPTSGDRSVFIVRPRTQATEFGFRYALVGGEWSTTQPFRSNPRENPRYHLGREAGWGPQPGCELYGEVNIPGRTRTRNNFLG